MIASRCFFKLLVAFLLPALLAFGQQPLHLEKSSRKQQVEFKLVKNLIIVPMMINGKGPYNFVLDTGVGVFIITDSTLVSTAEALRPIRISGFGKGREIDAFVSSGIPVTIGGHISGTLPAAVLKEDAFELSGYTGIPIHGLLGYEFFNSFVVRIDYEQKILTVYPPDKPRMSKKANRLPIVIESHKPYLNAEVGLAGEKIPVKLIIDTGAGHPISLEANENLPFRVPPESIPANLGVGLLGPIRGSLARVNYLKLGKFELKNVVAAFPDASDVAERVVAEHRNGNLGNSVLKRFSVLFDYGRECIYLKSTHHIKDPFEHDMSGLELTAGGPDYSRVLISRVEPGSAGDDCGLTADDEILAINFKPVSGMTLQEIDDLFRSRDDKSLLLDILPKNTTTPQRVLMTLKRRI